MDYKMQDKIKKIFIRLTMTCVKFIDFDAIAAECKAGGFMF
jgi:hypothetical protein